jgi:hypothetical protein
VDRYRSQREESHFKQMKDMEARILQLTKSASHLQLEERRASSEAASSRGVAETLRLRNSHLQHELARSGQENAQLRKQLAEAQAELAAAPPPPANLPDRRQPRGCGPCAPEGLFSAQPGAQLGHSLLSLGAQLSHSLSSQPWGSAGRLERRFPSRRSTNKLIFPAPPRAPGSTAASA